MTHFLAVLSNKVVIIIPFQNVILRLWKKKFHFSLDYLSMPGVFVKMSSSLLCCQSCKESALHQIRFIRHKMSFLIIFVLIFAKTTFSAQTYGNRPTDDISVSVYLYFFFWILSITTPAAKSICLRVICLFEDSCFSAAASPFPASIYFICLPIFHVLNKIPIVITIAFSCR